MFLASVLRPIYVAFFLLLLITWFLVFSTFKREHLTSVPCMLNLILCLKRVKLSLVHHELHEMLRNPFNLP